MTQKALITSLEHILANTYALYLKTQNFHWNVTGVHFYALHKMFEAQYTALAGAIDEIAERIRALDAKAPGSFSAFQKLTSLKDADPNINAAQMITVLRQDHLTLIDGLKQALQAAQTSQDDVTVDLIIERLSFHEKTTWMLNSSL